MKKTTFFILLLFFICSTQCGLTQEKIRVKAGEDFSAALSSYGIYRFPAFTKATIFFRDNTHSSALLNYNLALGDMQFIDNNGDTLSIANQGEIRYFYIDTVMYYYNRQYIEVLAGNDNIKLGLSQEIKIDFEKTGAYEKASPGVDVKTYGTYRSTSGGSVYQLTTNEDRVITRKINYFLLDKFGEITPATRRNFLRSFPAYSLAIEDYIKANAINFNNTADLKKLFLFCIQQY